MTNIAQSLILYLGAAALGVIFFGTSGGAGEGLPNRVEASKVRARPEGMEPRRADILDDADHRCNRSYRNVHLRSGPYPALPRRKGLFFFIGMVVVAIVVVLAAICMPAYNRIMDGMQWAAAYAQTFRNKLPMVFPAPGIAER